MALNRKRKKYLVVANWKMNPVTVSDAKKIWSATVKSAFNLKKSQVLVAPPSVYLSQCKTVSKSIRLGAQDGRAEESGQYTGDLSIAMLRSFGIKFLIIGHSEKRYQGETNESVSKKIAAALRLSLLPIVCIGENTRDTNGDYLRTLEQQILASLAGLSPAQVAEVVIAYEPVWAIGSQSKGSMEPRDLHETVLYIRKILRGKFGTMTGDSIQILYGGSVTDANAGSLIEHGMVQGFLVGRASLDPKIFSRILQAVDTSKT